MSLIAQQGATQEAPAGKLIVFEGADGVGKSAVVEELTSALARRGVTCVLSAFPGNHQGTLGQLVHRLHHDPPSLGVRAPTAASLQALHIAAHVDEIESRILPALRAGSCVLLDRFWWSTWVYGRAAAVEPHVLRTLIRVEKAMWRGVRPAFVFLMTRARLRSLDTARIEREYVHLAQRECVRQKVVPLANDGSVEQACAAVIETLDDLPELRAQRPHLAKPTASPQPLRVDIHIALRKPQPTRVFDSYWRFAAERQEVFFRRVENRPPPWTHDPVLNEHKFTNAYRAADRVSQYVIRKVIYEGDACPREVFFRTILFKLFNKVETWEYLRAAIGTVTAREFRVSRYSALLSSALGEGRKIYSGAYIMPTGTGKDRPRRKHEVHLKLVHDMLSDQLPERLADASSLAEAFSVLRNQPGLGDFLAFQYTIDLNYGPLLNFDEDDYIVPGPGARNGIRKCFTDLGDLDEAGAIRWVTENQEQEFRNRSLRFRSLWGRRLHLIDCQNLFCEVDKYARVVHPEAAGVNARVRIKQKFRPTPQRLDYWFPPKWRINDHVSAR